MAMQRVVPFVFEEEHGVRFLDRNGDPWAVVADVCRALGTRDASEAVEGLAADEKELVNLQRATGKTPEYPGLNPGYSGVSPPAGRGNPAVWVVSEGGLYTIVFRSRDALTEGTLAFRFRRWVTDEVLPEIRKTGGYGKPQFATAAQNLAYVQWVRKEHGEEAADQMLDKLGLPRVPAMRRRQGKLFGEDGGK